MCCRRAMTLNAAVKYLSVREQAMAAHSFKHHIDRALALNPHDATLHHMLGRWQFELSGTYTLPSPPGSRCIYHPTTPECTMISAIEAPYTNTLYKHPIEAPYRSTLWRHQWPMGCMYVGPHCTQSDSFLLPCRAYATGNQELAWQNETRFECSAWLRYRPQPRPRPSNHSGVRRSAR